MQRCTHYLVINNEQRRNQIWSYSKCSSTFGWWDFEGFTESTSSSHEQIIHDETLRISFSKENSYLRLYYSIKDEIENDDKSPSNLYESDMST